MWDHVRTELCFGLPEVCTARRGTPTSSTGTGLAAPESLLRLVLEHVLILSCGRLRDGCLCQCRACFLVLNVALNCSTWCFECFPSFLPCKVLIRSELVHFAQLRGSGWRKLGQTLRLRAPCHFHASAGPGRALRCWLRDFRTYRYSSKFSKFQSNFKTDTDRSILFWNFDIQESHLIALKITAKADQNIVRSPISSCLFCPGTWFQPIPIPRNVQGSRIVEGIGGSSLFTNHNHVTVGPSWSSRWCPSSCLTTLRWAILMSLCMKSSQLVKHGITTPDNLFHVSHLKLILGCWSSCRNLKVGLMSLMSLMSHPPVRHLQLASSTLQNRGLWVLDMECCHETTVPDNFLERSFCLNFTVMLLKTEDEWTQFLFGIWGVCAFVCWSLGDFGRGDLQSVKDRKKFGP